MTPITIKLFPELTLFSAFQVEILEGHDPVWLCIVVEKNEAKKKKKQACLPLL